MDVLRILVETNGFFTRAQAVDLGCEDADLTSGVRHGVLVRFRRGYYTFCDLWNALDRRGRHLVRLRAVLDSLGPAVSASHVSGALLHGVKPWGVPLDRVHVTRLDGGASRIEGDVIHHVGRTLGDDVVEVDGLRVLRPDRCAVETGSMGSAESALVTFDSFLHRGLGSHDELFARFERMEHWPRTRHLHVPVRMADGGADGPGESRGRWLFRCSGIPAPVVQYEVWSADGTLLGTTDWGWPEHGLLGEFDGRVKYGRLLRPGQEAGDVVFAEKRREDLLREASGHRMVRLIWSDLGRPRLTAHRVGSLLRRGS